MLATHLWQEKVVHLLDVENDQTQTNCSTNAAAQADTVPEHVRASH